MDRADPAKQHSILSGPPGDGSPEPNVEAAGGDIQQAYASGEWDRRPGLPL